jgi:hypothetical protein
MHDTYSPPLWAVMGCLANILVSVAMIWYLIFFLSSCDACSARPFALAFIVGFLVILLLTGFELFKLLFAGRKKSRRTGSMVARIIEIDGKVN